MLLNVTMFHQVVSDILVFVKPSAAFRIKAATIVCSPSVMNLCRTFGSTSD
jgi:hypothetical protein